MTRVANFGMLSDQSFDLKIGDDIDKTLSENITGTPVSGSGAFLMWNVRREGTGTVKYEVKLNDQNPNKYVVDLKDWSSVHEAFNTSSIKQGTNKVEFKVTGGSGTLSIGDVVLFYREDV